MAVAEAIEREVERINDERDDVYLTVVNDQSDFIRQSIASVRTSAIWGSLLAICVLYVFLRNRSSTSIIARLMMSAAVPCMGALMAVRSAA